MSENTGKKTLLEFYDGWKPDYIYFNSLLNAETWANKPQYDTDFIVKQAQKASGEAQSHRNIEELDDQKSIERFSANFLKIIDFLKKARDYEKMSEYLYFSNKLKQLQKSFSKEERQKIPALQTCMSMCNNELTFNYVKFTSQINILLQGLEQTKTIAKYEERRIDKIRKTMKTIIQKKNLQLDGQVRANKLIKQREDETAEDYEKRVMKHRQKVEDRFMRNIKIEYATTGQLARKNNTNGRYRIAGAYRFKNFQQTAGRELAAWAESALKSIQNNATIISELAKVISSQYPPNGNFAALTEKVRTVIVLGVVEYGRRHLNQILNKRLKPILIDNMVEELTSDNNDIFNQVLSLNLTGLPANFGTTVREAQIAKDISSLNQMSSKKGATELFSLIEQLITREQELMQSGQGNSLLLTAMQKTNSSEGNLYEKALQLLELVNNIKKLKDNIENDMKKYVKIKEAQEKEYTISSHTQNPVTIKVIIKGKDVQVDMSPLNQLMVESNITKQSNAKTLSSLLGTAVSRASKTLHQDIITALNNAHQQQQFGNLTEKEILSTVDSELRSVKININGPTLEEILAPIDFSRIGNKNTVPIYNAKQNLKNDFVIIQLDDKPFVNNMQKLVNNNIINEDQYQKILEKYRKTVDEAQKQLLLTIQQVGDREIGKIIHTKDTTSQRYSLRAKYSLANVEQLAKEYPEIQEQLKKLNAVQKKLDNYIEKHASFDQTTLDSKKEILNSFSQTIKISGTVKAYNTYYNKMGFTGGSLGGNFESQLDTIANIFQSAGLPLEDLKWLRSAILNCFPSSVVGESNKGLLENYLGAVAAFALFDEGGQESMIISDTYKKFFENIRTESQERILHLYKVNSLYVPGSYVLEQTIMTLENEVLPKMEAIPQVINQGAGVTIINTASRADINKKDGSNAWAATGARAKQHITIQILFLANLLGLLKSINEKLGQAEVPA